MNIRIGDKIIWSNAEDEVYEVVDIDLSKKYNQILWSYWSVGLGRQTTVWAYKVEHIERQIKL